MSKDSDVLKLVLLVSCSHALVHLLEQSIASVEQVISDDLTLSFEQSGWLGTSLRFPYGFGAFLAGLLADRIGEKRVLVLYLIGSGLVCLTFQNASGVGSVYLSLFALGSFASMYHPAGLALLANETTPEYRSRALGTHGVFGSLGIASAPFLAGAMLTISPGNWTGYYLLLGALSSLLGVLIWWLLKPQTRRGHRYSEPSAAQVSGNPNSPQPGDAASQRPVTSDDRHFQLWPFFLLVAGAGLSGIVYGGVLHFLPRYLKEAGLLKIIADLTGHTITDAAAGNYAAALALICGVFGQWAAGRIAQPGRMPVQLAIVYALNIPFLIWMTVADGGQRLLAACLWAFCHFMNQPLYNSLLPEYIPRHRRSAGFGFSNMIGFGLGSAGPPLVAFFDSRFGDYTRSYAALAGLAVIAAILPLPLRSKSLPRSRSGIS
ncbi:MAG: MFS transporter [Planctomycetaceae bacterium]